MRTWACTWSTRPAAIDPPPFPVVEDAFERGLWHKVEIYQKQGVANDGIVRVWVDGVLAVDRSDVDMHEDENGLATPFDNVTISDIWAASAT